ncbi:DUF2695 domain-containing protein [Amycolatopsis anabasis]|uniref:DUF2695 domain-containing protein n=1 Tax=Amycolatopsis anabasis TaxID=1840409 RepID=UPI00131C38DE|nr:DUF2695 domain-containing protein [Amycolatopsis anabasis]
MNTGPLAEAENLVGDLQEQWTTPVDRECLACFVVRMLDDFGCDGTFRWTRRWRDACAPRATALEERLENRGAFCDCEIAWNVYPEQMLATEEEEASGAPPPPCSGVSRRGSTKPCRNHH